jgi:citrate lyase subunit beta/citryl-CoA lyase
MVGSVLRSVLFMPANRLDFVEKVGVRFAPDAVVLDLEDGTPDAEKIAARAAAREAAEMLAAGPFRGSVWVRVNPPASPLFDEDVAAIVQGSVAGVVVPKVETPAELTRTERLLTRIERDRDLAPRQMMVGLETVAGVANAAAILQIGTRVTAAYFGAEDFTADLGARRTRGGLEVLHPRSQVVAAARLGGVVALDQVVVDIRDAAGFAEDAEVGRDLGYQGKLLVHPGQIEAAHAVFTPSEEEVARATRLLECYERARNDGRGTLDFEGQMVDTPLVERARQLLAQARVSA